MLTIIFLNGELPGKNIIGWFIKDSDLIIAADGVSNYLKKIKIVPDIILGDFDSVKPETLNFFKKKNVEIIKLKDQSTTDFEKCLLYCLKTGINNVIVFGATGLRADHNMNNFSILKRYYKKIQIKFITEDFEIFFISKLYKFKYKVNEIVSLIGIPFANGIKTKGLEFRLNNENLKFGVREGSLNKSTSENITIDFKSGNLLLFIKHFIK